MVEALERAPHQPAADPLPPKTTPNLGTFGL